MIKLIRTDSDHAEFIKLVNALDEYLAMRNGKIHTFYSKFNLIDSLRHVVLAFENNEAIACGAMKKIENGVMEIKRMYTVPAFRKKGIAGMILIELENWAKEKGYKKCILETGSEFKDALSFYQKEGYLQIENYGQYKGIETSVCFEKLLYNEI